MTYKWGDLISLEYGKPVKDKARKDGKYPVYGTNGQIGTSDLPPLCNHASFILGRKGAYRGVHYSSTPFSVIDTAFYAVNLHPELLDIKWAYYKFLTYDINSMDSGSAIPSTDRYEIYAIEVELPNTSVQEKQVQLLECFDDKILNLRQINDNLERQVSVLYQSWFEDFELTNGVCPENWRYQELSAIADIASGKRPPVKSEVCNQETPISIVGAASVMGFTSKANHTDKILVTGRVGTNGVIQRFNTPCWTSDNTLVITSPYYEFTNQILHRIDYSSMNRGSTQPLITQGDMKKVVVLVPDEDTLAKFEVFAGSLMAKWEANIKENVKLASLRDTLLPRLMSGEIDVSGIHL